ncbi:MAG: hypothetical protein P1V51_08490 [Deltaproteobacteria bacterium]|nr:hypothetical protein [Deltaproteobacteria bacterium]
MLLALPASALAEAVKGEEEAPLPSLGFLGMTAGAGVEEDQTKAVADYIQTDLVAIGAYRVMGQSEIQALLDLESKKQLMGCGEASCIAEIAGALGTDRALTGTLARLGESVILNLSLLDVDDAKVILRAGRRVEGAGTLEKLLDQVRSLLLELVDADPEAEARNRLAAGASTRLIMDLGLRLDGDLLAAADLRPIPGLTFSLGTQRAAGEVTLLWVPSSGLAPGGVERPFVLRLQGRYQFRPASRIQPFAAGGVVLAIPDLALRAAFGARFALGSRFYALTELAFERFLVQESPELFDPNAFVFGAGFGVSL